MDNSETLVILDFRNIGNIGLQKHW